MNVNGINNIPDFRLQGGENKSSQSSSDKKDFKSVLDKSSVNDKGMDKKIEKHETKDTNEAAENKEQNTESSEIKTSELKENSNFQGNIKSLSSEIGTVDLNLIENIINNKLSNLDEKKEEVFDFGSVLNKITESKEMNSNEVSIDEEVFSILSSLMNFLNSIKSNISSNTESSEISSSVNKLLSGDMSINDFLTSNKISADVKENIKNQGFDKLLSEKDNKAANEILKLVTSEFNITRDNADNSSKLDSLISTISDLLRTKNLDEKVNINSEVISEKETTVREISNLITEILTDKKSITDESEVTKLLCDLQENLKTNNLQDIFDEKDKKLVDSIIKLLNADSNEKDEKVDVLINKLSGLISSDLKPEKIKKEDILWNKIKSLISNIEDEKNQDVKIQGTDLLEQKAKYKDVKDNFSAETKVDNGEENNTSKESKFLDELINKKDDSSFSKLIQFNNLNRTNSLNDISNGLPTISKNTAVQDIIQTFKYMETNELKELTVKIKPKELGEITIKLIAQGEIMKASINASSKETYDLLNSKVPEIKHMLTTQNIKIEDVSIDFNDNFQSFQFGEGNFSREQGNSQSRLDFFAKNNIETTESEEETNVFNNLNILA